MDKDRYQIMDEDEEALEEYLEILSWVKKRVEPVMEEKDALLMDASTDGFSQTVWFAMLQLAFQKNIDKGADPNELIESMLSLLELTGEDGFDKTRDTLH
jgi:hypothetical protein